MASEPAMKKCQKADCLRRVSAYAAYCCTRCVAASRYGHEQYSHTEPCDRRSVQRGLWKVTT